MITFESVSKQYGSAPAVDSFSLEVPSHACVALVGSSGCGKTTLLKLVNRMLTPSSGRVLIDEVDVAQQDPISLRRSIGYVMQSGGLLPHLTVEANINTIPRLLGAPASSDRIHHLMESLELDPALGRKYPYQLSGGQAQRVGVARALIFDPNILLMDEPFAAVDPIVRHGLQEMVAQLQRDFHKTIILVTHDFSEACFLGDTVAVLSVRAHIEQHATPREILTHPATPFVEKFIQATRPLKVD